MSARLARRRDASGSASCRVATSPENTRYPTATAFSAAMSTAPAAMSFAIFAIGSNDVDATSTAASTAVFTSSATSTNVIARSSTASSSFVAPNPTAAMRTATATAKWIQRFRCVRTAWTIPSAAKLKLWKSDVDCLLIASRALALARSSPRRGRSRAGGGARARAARASSRRPRAGQRTTSPSARGSPSGSSSRPSSGNESTSVASSIPRCSCLSARISSSPTQAIPSSPSVTPSARNTLSASASAPRSSTEAPLRLAVSMTITGGAPCRSPRRGACTPPRSAARACAARRPRFRTRRSRCRRCRRGCRAPESVPTPARAAGRPG